MRPLYLAGAQRRTDGRAIEVLDKSTGASLATVARADGGDLDAALAAAARACPPMAALPPEERAASLHRAADRLEARAEELSQLLVAEGGKPVTYARGEVGRAIATFRISAREALGPHEEALSIRHGDQARGRLALRRRVPLGVASFITPFNFPLNLVAHKVAPALAAGCPFVLKPASATPLSALALGEVLAELGLPEGAFSILPCRGGDAGALVTDDRVAKVSFTGSDEVGWDLHARAGRKRVTLELGGNAAVVVDGTADVEAAAAAIVGAAYGQAGQSCISVQRIIATADVHERLRDALVERARTVAVGDPRDEATVVGPMIDADEAGRVERWVAEALRAGARRLAGGERDGAWMPATLLEDVPVGSRVLDEEVFGPVAVLQRAADFDAALAEANRTRFGLQAGVFTTDLRRAHRAWEVLEVGGVIVGDVPTWRADAMPYGGVKDSGIGHEGPRWAIDSMSQWRLMVIDPR